MPLFLGRYGIYKHFYNVYANCLYVQSLVWLTREGFIAWLVFTMDISAVVSLKSTGLSLFGIISHFRLSTNNFLFDMEWALS